MTDEQDERAARVWREACAAFEDAADPELPKFENVNAGDRAATAAIAREFEALEAENARLREALIKANEPHWFYLGDDCSSDQCRDGIDECITEDFEWDNRAAGDHVLLISGARLVPDMWVALHYFTDAERDERGDDEPYSYTVHATEEEARAALGASHDADA